MGRHITSQMVPSLYGQCRAEVGDDPQVIPGPFEVFAKMLLNVQLVWAGGSVSFEVFKEPMVKS